VLLRDTDGDDKADAREIMLGGFDTHDTHHAISAYTADPSGAFVMCEGVFLHSNVETPTAPSAASMAASSATARSAASWSAPPSSASRTLGLRLRRLGPGFLPPHLRHQHELDAARLREARLRQQDPLHPDLVPEGHKVRPTSGLEIVSSRHFPDEVQGDIILCNAIGFLGIKQHSDRPTTAPAGRPPSATICSSARTAISAPSISSSRPMAPSTSSTGTTSSSATCSTTPATPARPRPRPHLPHHLSLAPAGEAREGRRRPHRHPAGKSESSPSTAPATAPAASCAAIPPPKCCPP
jgi:hypothetical protein